MFNVVNINAWRLIGGGGGVHVTYSSSGRLFSFEINCNNKLSILSEIKTLIYMKIHRHPQLRS